MGFNIFQYDLVFDLFVLTCADANAMIIKKVVVTATIAIGHDLHYITFSYITVGDHILRILDLVFISLEMIVICN